MGKYSLIKIVKFLYIPLILLGLFSFVWYSMFRAQSESFSNYVDNRVNNQIYNGRYMTNEDYLKRTTVYKNVFVCSSGYVKTYMDYKKIKTKTSKQYKYISKYMNSNEKGFLVDKDNYIGVALGSYFGEIGTKYLFTFENGTSVPVVKVEAKSDRHTINGCYQYMDKSVLEFVIDVDKASKYYGVGSNGYILNGSYGNVFKGKIKKIERVVE